MYKGKRVAAVILAAGNGSRMGSSENKVCLLLDGRQMIEHTLWAFAKHSYVDELVLAVRDDERAEMEALASQMGKPTRVVIGGATRQASVYAAISELKSEIVLVHDGARPLVRGTCIAACVEALDRYDGVIPVLPIEEQVCRVGKKRSARPEALKQALYGAQTPQCFDTKILRRCHERHREAAASTDDSRLLEIEGYKVGVVEGDPVNIKITTPLDLLVVKAYLESEIE